MKIPAVLDFLPFSAIAVILGSAREIASAQENLNTTRTEDMDYAKGSIEVTLLCCDSNEMSQYKRFILGKHTELVANEAVRLISLRKINNRLKRRTNEQT